MPFQVPRRCRTCESSWLRNEDPTVLGGAHGEVGALKGAESVGGAASTASRRVGESLPRLGGSARVGEAFSRFGESLQLRQGLYLVSWQLTSVGAVADWLERSGTILFYAFGGLAGL